MTINIPQGEIVNVETTYIGQTLAYGSGATTSVTEITASRPYLWSDTTVTLAGSTISNAKNITFEINNNLVGPHYLNGSRDVAVPFFGNKDYTLTLTADMDSDLAWLYREYHKSGSVFNGTLDLNADTATAIGNITAGSQHAIFTMSGCVVTSFSLPSTDDEVNEAEIEIRPKNVSAVEYHKATLFNPF